MGGGMRWGYMALNWASQASKAQCFVPRNYTRRRLPSLKTGMIVLNAWAWPRGRSSSLVTTPPWSRKHRLLMIRQNPKNTCCCTLRPSTSADGSYTNGFIPFPWRSFKPSWAIGGLFYMTQINRQRYLRPVTHDGQKEIICDCKGHHKQTYWRSRVRCA